jgi:hypothetical protein
MEGANLPTVCILSFAVVFAVLAVMAVIMRILIRVFPEQVRKIDAPTLAAITAAVSTHYPATRITEVKEIE